MSSILPQVGVGSVCVVLCCLAAEKSRVFARETDGAIVLLLKWVHAENCQQAQVFFFLQKGQGRGGSSSMAGQVGVARAREKLGQVQG